MNSDTRRPVESDITEMRVKTRVPGVISLGKNRYEVRARIRVPGQKQLDKKKVINGSLAEAARLKKEMEEDLVAKTLPTETKEAIRLGDFAKKWLRGKWSTLTPTTRARYVGALDVHILPTLGDMVLNEMTFADIEQWRDKLSQTLSSSSVNGHLNILRSILKKAELAGLVPRNPALTVQYLPQEDTRITYEEPNALTVEQVKVWIKKAKELYPQHYPMILTLVTTGMRFSAARALKFSDLDGDKKVIVVQRRVSGKDIVPGVKRDRNAVDIVPLVPELHRALKEARIRMTPTQRQSGLCFPSDKGRPRARSVLQKPFLAISKAAGIEIRFTPHGLRRTANDLYRQVASPVVTMSITGHRTDKMHDHYSTVGTQEKTEAAERAFSRILDKSKKEVSVTEEGPSEAGVRVE